MFRGDFLWVGDLLSCLLRSESVVLVVAFVAVLLVEGRRNPNQPEGRRPIYTAGLVTIDSVGRVTPSSR